jgi:putative nucleotidyltransferase with HDIG domain
MKTSTSFLRSKVAHRVVLLFFSCALLPITILTLVSFHEVSSQLQRESEKRLTQTSKAQGMEIYERLTALDSDLQLLSAQVEAHLSLDDGAVLENHFKGLTAFSADGDQRFHWGTTPALPQLTSAERQRLLAGNPLLQIGSCSREARSCVSLLRQTHAKRSGTTILLGELNPDYLFATEDLPAGLQFAVLSASGALIISSDNRLPSTKPFALFSRASGLCQWKREGTLYDAAYWKLPVRPHFGAEPWTIVVSQEHSQVAAPILSFRRSFSLVILLSVWVVLFFSLVQIRRTLGPLERLREGTDRIGAGRFESRVEVQSGDEFEDLAGSFNRMAAQLGRQFLTLKAIHEIDQAIFASLDREAIVDGVLARMPALVPGAGFGVCIFGESRSTGWMRFRDADAPASTATAGLAAADWLQLQNNPAGFYLAAEAPRLPEYLQPLKQAGTQSFLVLPIRVDHSIEGVLVCAQKAGAPALDDMQETRQVADQLAVAFSHVRLITALEQLQWGTLTALARAIDAKSQWTAGHSERVTNLAMAIGRNMALSAQDLRIMQMGGLLHDIGKIGTPPGILDKPGKLTPSEMSIMQDHVRTGIRILEPIPGFREALPIIAQPHEWFNGKGYPKGVAGKDISLHARIFAVADCYDALTSDRPYRAGLPPEQSLAMVQEKSGIQFDPEVVEVFTRMMADKIGKPTTAAASAGQST